jgi:hypothetical protein
VQRTNRSPHATSVVHGGLSDGAGPATFPNDLAMALAAELAEYRRLPYATAFRFIRRLDALLLRVPRVRRVIAAAMLGRG